MYTWDSSRIEPRERAPDGAAPADLDELATRNPLALLRSGAEWYRAHVQEYRCTLTKQERLGENLSDVQEIELRFRRQPQAVYMLWRVNAGSARRVLYRDGDPQYVNEKGEKLARVEPNGAIARLFVQETFVPVDGPEARRNSRRTVDKAGFQATFDALARSNSYAAEHGVLDIRYTGMGTIDGRPTLIIERSLPYAGPDGPYPDAHLVLHVDREWLLPVAICSYADAGTSTLLGSYVFTAVDLNPHFEDRDFQF
jgi:hypothetical protein